MVDGVDIYSVYVVTSLQLASAHPSLVSAALVSRLGIAGGLIKISAVDAYSSNSARLCRTLTISKVVGVVVELLAEDRRQVRLLGEA